MEILSQRWHHEHAGKGLRVPEVEWRRRVVVTAEQRAVAV